MNKNLPLSFYISYLLKCTAGTLTAVIDELGMVYPCETSRVVFGSLREENYDFGEIWHSNTACSFRKTVRLQGCRCTHESNIITNVSFPPRFYLTFPVDYLEDKTFMNVYYSVIIPFHGSMTILEKVLQSLKNTQYPQKEIIVVNDGTGYDFNTIVERYQCSLIDLPRRYGPSFARNAGAKAANFEYLVFLDSDIVVPKDCFIKINDFLNANRSVSVMNCLISSHSPYSNFFSQYANMYFRYNILKKSRTALFTSFCIIGLGSFREVGGFDVSIPLQYADDLVLGWKLYNNECKFALVKSVEVTHYKKTTFLQLILWLFLHAYFYGKYQVIYRRKSTSLKLFLRKEGIFSVTMILLISILVYFKLLSLSMSGFIILVLFWGINFNFFNFLLREKKYLFTFKSIWIAILQEFIYIGGAFIGTLRGFFVRGKCLKNLTI